MHEARGSRPRQPAHSHTRKAFYHAGVLVSISHQLFLFFVLSCRILDKSPYFRIPVSSKHADRLHQYLSSQSPSPEPHHFNQKRRSPSPKSPGDKPIHLNHQNHTLKIEPHPNPYRSCFSSTQTHPNPKQTMCEPTNHNALDTVSRPPTRMEEDIYEMDAGAFLQAIICLSWKGRVG